MNNRFPPKKNAELFESRSLSNPSLKKFIEASKQDSLKTWPPLSWDSSDLIIAAYYFNPDLDIARARWAMARGNKKSSTELPNPTLSVTPGYNTTTRSPSPWIPNAVLDFLFETAGKRGHRIARAEFLSEAARLNIAVVAWQVRSRVQSCLLDLFAAIETDSLIRRQQQAQAERLHILELKYAAGDISAFELRQARLELKGSTIIMRNTERRKEEMRVKLAESVGVPVEALSGVEFSFDDLTQLPDSLSLSDLRKQALLHRPDILSALAEYSACEEKLRLEIAGQYPDISLAPGYEYDQGDNKWSVGLSLTLPMFNRNRGAIAEARAKCSESAAQFNALQAGVIAEIDMAIAGYRSACRKQADIDNMLVEIQRQEKTASAIYDAGEISKSELLAVQVNQNATALNRLEALVQSRQAYNTLENAIQSPLALSVDIWQTPLRESEPDNEKEHP